MSKEMPGRKVFFPNDRDHYRDSYYIRTIFNRCWYKYNKKTSDRNVVVYSFRHNYAVQNILSWKHTGYDFDMNLLALCKSMGHQRPESTLYYFHLVPQLADMLEDIEGDSICEILPDIL
jgi:integrase